MDDLQLKKLAEQLDELCPAPPGADVIAWLRSTVAEARAQQLDPMTATRFIDESYLRWVWDQEDNR